MNVLIIGQNTKIANVFSTFANNVFLVVDSVEDTTKFTINRVYKENEKYKVLSSATDITNMKNIPRRIREIRKWVKENEIDIIFTNEKNSMISSRLAFLLSLHRPLLLATSHDSRSWKNSNKVWLFSKLIRLTTDGYVSLAKFVYLSVVKNGIPKSKVLHLPNTVESELFTRKKDYSICGGIIQMAYTAVVYPGKGQITIIHILKTLKDRGIIANIDFIGDVLDCGYKDVIVKCANMLGVGNQFNFLGRIDNVELRTKLYMYDIYLCPSHMEMSPYNVLEAKSVGLPVIASNVGGIPDLITDGVDGFLVSFNDCDEFSNKIELLVKNDVLREKIGCAALAYTQTHNAMAAGRLLKLFIKSLSNDK